VLAKKGLAGIVNGKPLACSKARTFLESSGLMGFFSANAGEVILNHEVIMRAENFESLWPS
jgi:hypothetical protein